MKTGYGVVYRMTQADVDAGKANSIAGARIEIVDSGGQKTGVIMESGAAGSAPSVIATAGTVQSAVGLALNVWEPNTAVVQGEVRRATVVVGAVGVGDFMVSNSARTTRAAFDATEATNWVELANDPDAVLLTGDQTVGGKKTFSTLPEVSADAIVDNQLVRKSQHDAAVNPKADADSVARVHDQAFTTSKALCHPVNFVAASATGTDGSYAVSHSSAFDAGYAGWKAFDNTDATDWATQGVTANFWVQLQLPVKKIIARVIARGRNSGIERVTSWRIEASNDGTTWTTLHSSTTALGNTAQTFDITNKIAYLYYRLFAVSGEASNPGLSRLEFHESVPAVAAATTSAAGLMSGADKTKLDGIAVGATVNDTDANLKNRANHTGTQAQSTIVDLATALSAKAPLASPAFTGTPTGIAKAHVGLGNADNTADTAKPVSTAQQTALDAKQAALSAAQIDALNKIQMTPTRAIPTFTAPTTAGTLGNYIASASSEFSATYAAWTACKAVIGDWATQGVTSNFWIRIQLPVAKVVAQIRVAGRSSGSEVPGANWRLEGSNNGTAWTTLYTGTAAMTGIGVDYQVGNSTAYLYYRIFCPTGTGTNPGMSIFWLYENEYGFPVVAV